jgi:Gram-negative bacterial TonB protein C-terminal
MKNILLIIFLFPILAYSQSDSTDCSKNYSKYENGCFVVEQMPSIIGGFDSVYKKLVYPKEAIKGDIVGKVYVKVIIDTLGNPHCPTILKGLISECNEAAIKAIMSSHFIPAIARNKKVLVPMVIPLKFGIN